MEEVEFLLFGLIIFCIGIILVCLALDAKNYTKMNKAFRDVGQAISQLKEQIKQILDHLDNN